MVHRIESYQAVMKFAGIMMAGFILALARFVPADAAVAWHDGPGASANTINCITQNVERLITAFVGWKDDIASPPRANSVYYIHVWWAILGNPCVGGARVAPEFSLPKGTRLAISKAKPVVCFAYDFRVSPPKFTRVRVGCPQSAATGPRGGLGFYPKDPKNRTWPNAWGRGWEIQVPVTSTRGGTLLTGRVWAIDGIGSPWVDPQVVLPRLRAAPRAPAQGGGV